MKKIRNISLLAAFFLVLIPSFSLAATDVNSEEFQSVIKQLDMQGHADHEYSTCSVKKVYYQEVMDALDEGESGKEILQSYVDEFGQAALRTPGTGLVGIVAWSMPVVGMILGALIVGFGIKKWTKKTAASESLAIEAIPEIEREIVELTIEEERRKRF